MNKMVSKLGLFVALAVGTLGQQALADTLAVNDAKGAGIFTHARTTTASPADFVVPANTVFALHSVVLSNPGVNAVNGVTIAKNGVNKTADITVPANSSIEITFPKAIIYSAGQHVDISTTDATNGVNVTFDGTIR